MIRRAGVGVGGAVHFGRFNERGCRGGCCPLSAEPGGGGGGCCPTFRRFNERGCCRLSADSTSGRGGGGGGGGGGLTGLYMYM